MHLPMVQLSLVVLLVLLVSKVDQESPPQHPPEESWLRMVRMVEVVPHLCPPQFHLVAVPLLQMLPLVRVALLLLALDRGDILVLLVLVVHSNGLH